MRLLTQENSHSLFSGSLPITHHNMAHLLAEIEKIVIADTVQLSDSWFKEDILASLGDVTIEWVELSTNDDQSGIVAVHLATPGGVAVLD